MKHMKIEMKCTVSVCTLIKKYHCFIVLAEIEHTIPCIFYQCRSVWKSLQVLSAQIHTNSIISFVETFRVFWECNFKNKMLAGKTVYMCGKVMRKGLK